MLTVKILVTPVKVWAHKERLKLNGTHRLLVHTDDVNLFNTKKNTYDLFTAIKLGCLEANVKSVKQMSKPYEQNVW